MKNTISLLFLLIFLSTSCNQSNSNDLRKLTIDEIIERVKSNQVPNIEEAIFKDQNGKIIPLEVFQKIVTQDEFAADTYVDANGVIKEILIRKATAADKIAEEKLENVLKELNTKRQKKDNL